MQMQENVVQDCKRSSAGVLGDRKWRKIDFHIWVRVISDQIPFFGGAMLPRSATDSGFETRDSGTSPDPEFRTRFLYPDK